MGAADQPDAVPAQQQAVSCCCPQAQVVWELSTGACRSCLGQSCHFSGTGINSALLIQAPDLI